MDNIEFLNWIAKGFNPYTGEKFSDCDLLSDEKVSFRLNELGKELKEEISYIEKFKKVKIEFTLEMAEKIFPFEEDITISKIAKKINEIFPLGQTTIINRIQNFLIEKGFLEERLTDESDPKSKNKYAVGDGLKIGLYNVARKDYDERPFNSVFYSAEAQEYLKPLLPKILNCELKIKNVVDDKDKLNLSAVYERLYQDERSLKLVKYIYRVQGAELRRLDFYKAAAVLEVDRKTISRECSKLADLNVLIIEDDALKINPDLIFNE